MYSYPKYEKKSRDFKFLSAIGYVRFIERMADSQLGEGLQSALARRLTVIAFILGATGIGIVSGLLVYASDQNWSMLPFFALLAVAMFIAWLSEAALVIQVNRAMFKHFDERMEQIYLEAKARSHSLSVVIFAFSLFFAPALFLTIQNLDVAFAVYVAFAIPIWVVVASAQHIVLSWMLGASGEQSVEDDL